MKEQNCLVLKPGATLTETDGRVGIRLGDKLRYAENPAQAALLRALAREPQTLDALSALLRVRDGPLPEDTATALATAAFILDFTEFYDTGGKDPPKESSAIKKQTNHF
ncbi:MAG: hypothetical protein RR336_06255 [Oscillospiraceae bacterium]